MLVTDKKKIVFYMDNLLMGGIGKALISMLKCADFSDYDVEVKAIDTNGILKEELLSLNVKVSDIPLDEDIRKELINNQIKKKLVEDIKKLKIIDALRVYIRRINGDFFSHFDFDFNDIDKDSNIYDIVICYQMHNPFLVKYIADKVNADKKIAWIHNDFNASGYKIEFLNDELKCYDRFYAVSKLLKDEFIEHVPAAIDRTDILYNFVDTNSIIDKANEYIPDDFIGDIKILSVGRLDRQKGFDMAISVANELKQNGYKFQFYIIGKGSEYDNLTKLVDKYRLNDCVHLLGEKKNPYPYFKLCDIYCQTSRHEGFCTTTNEAKIFKKPILTTDVAGSDEQFKDGFNGLIVKKDVKSIYNGIIKLFDSDYRDELSKNL